MEVNPVTFVGLETTDENYYFPGFFRWQKKPLKVS
jgi:hypothetical protein